MTVTIENTNVDTTLNIAELTTASLTGTGVFDVLLQTLRLHLDREFTSGRITGTAYATVYSQAITSFLQQAVGFCLSKAKLALELQQMQEQVTLLQKQQAQVEAQTALLSYELTITKPVEVANLTKQGVLLDSQTDVANKQALNIEAETAQTTYKTTYNLPEEVKVTQYTQDRVLAEVNKLANDTVASIKQSRLVDAQTAQVTYTTSNILPAQLALTTAQKESSDAQTALYEQKVVTETAQAVSTPATGSVMGVQNALMAKQTENYDRDAEQKAAKLMLETINVRFTADSTSADFDYVNHLSDADVGVAVSKLITGIGGTVAPPPPPPPTP